MNVVPALPLPGMVIAESADTPDGLVNKYGFVRGFLILAAMCSVVLVLLFLRNRRK